MGRLLKAGERKLFAAHMPEDGVRIRDFLTQHTKFVLVAASSPCRCGYYNDPVKECTCSATNVLRYQKRISGRLSPPLRFRDLRLDRIDIHPLRSASGICNVKVPRIDSEELSADRRGQTSQSIRARVEAARERQRARLAGTDLQCNGDMGPAEVRAVLRDRCREQEPLAGRDAADVADPVALRGS